MTFGWWSSQADARLWRSAVTFVCDDDGQSRSRGPPLGGGLGLAWFR